MADVTPNDVIEAARRIYNRKGWFTAKDVWYELRISDRFAKYDINSGDVRIITQILHKKEIVGKIERIDIGIHRYAYYRMKEE